jgi:hypothetical protein
MSELTDTAFIAERLFPKPEWDESKCRVCGWPLSIKMEDGCVKGDCAYRPTPKSRADGQSPFNPTNWNDIRRMEDALGKDSLYFDYARHLCTMVSGMDYFIGSNQTPDWLVCLRANAAQRVAACVKGLREVQA